MCMHARKSTRLAIIAITPRSTASTCQALRSANRSRKLGFVAVVSRGYVTDSWLWDRGQGHLGQNLARAGLGVSTWGISNGTSMGFSKAVCGLLLHRGLVSCVYRMARKWWWGSTKPL